MSDQRKSTTVLVVDDHPAIRSTMTDVLEAEGFIPEHAENGSDAIRKCIENDYDFVLLDMQMPDMNGVEVLRQLKAKNRYHSKFIVITAFSIQELEDQACELGIYAFLRKPIKVEKIIEIIRDNRGISILLHLEDTHLRTGISHLLEDSGFLVTTTKNHDDALNQLRQINYNFVIYDSDSPGIEQDAIQRTIKTMNSDTHCVETNEDESPKQVSNRIKQLIEQAKKVAA
ncbi:MAG TPA: hypothetical protein DCY32_09935 [Opitutae bacterium]|nr:hypothetical protein [Opitutae bacterium]